MHWYVTFECGVNRSRDSQCARRDATILINQSVVVDCLLTHSCMSKIKRFSFRGWQFMIKIDPFLRNLKMTLED